MALTTEEQAQLDALTEKSKAPASNRNESVNVTIDLSDLEAVKRAQKLGLLSDADLEAAAGGDDDDDDDDPAKPRRRRTPKKVDKDPAPRRRLTGADRWGS